VAKRYGEGSITEYQTKSGKRYTLVYGYKDRSGVSRQKRISGFKTKAEAQKAAREALHTRDRGRHLDPSDMTVEKYAREEYIPSLIRRERAPITIKSYITVLERYVFPTVGKLPLQQVTRFDVTAMLDEIARLAPTTRKLSLTLLSALLDRALADDLIHVNPAKHPNIDKPTGKAIERKPWDVEEAKKFLNSLSPDKDDLELAFMLMALTGIRRGEAAGLRWGDVDLDAGLLHIQRSASSVDGRLVYSDGGKTENATRFVGLVPEVQTLLARHKMREVERFWANGKQFNDESAVFATWTCGPRAPHTFSTRFQAAVRRAGCRPMPLHGLRHLAITEAQHDPRVSQAMLGKIVGHGSASITAVYTHADQEAALKVADSIAGRLLG
jgi:integrase